MKYRIVYATSADKNSARNLYVVVLAYGLSGRIASLQDSGNIIISVRQEN